MTDERHIFDALRQTRILHPPRHTLATFGTTTLDYVLLSPIPGEADQCRLREGQVTAQRPKILTPEFLKERFEGFGENADAYREVLERAYGTALRGLEYAFKNEVKNTSLEHTSLPELTERARVRLREENAPRKALLQSPDAAWGLAIMKFIVDTSLRSFQSNVKELEDRGLFDPDRRADTSRRRDIEKLFAQAEKDRAAIARLGETLQQSGLFAEYEDRFFSLVQR